MDKYWFVPAFFSAFSLATSDAMMKKAFNGRDEYAIAVLRLFFSALILFAVFLFIEKPALDATFYKAFAATLPLELIALIFYTKALKTSPLSLSLPFLSLSPVFLIGTSYLIVGESISTNGIFGILLIALGGYFLNISKLAGGIFEPFYAIGHEKGSIYMIIVAFIYSISASTGKLALQHSSPLFFGSAFAMAMFLLCATTMPFLCHIRPGELVSKSALKASFLPGVFYALMVIFHMVSLNMTKTAYMISVKRLSLLIGVLYGYFLFNESCIRERLFAAALMVAGVTVIAVFQ